MNSALLPLYLAAVVLLAVSSLVKLRRPETAMNALRELGVPRPDLVVRGGAVAELIVAAAMVVMPEVGAPAGAVLFLGFSAFVAAQVRHGSTRSCGCLGAAELPPTLAHVALTVALAGVCVAARPDPLRMLAQHPISGAIVWLAAAAAAWCLAAALQLLPAALTAYRRPTS
jgi:hypothetical protein